MDPSNWNARVHAVGVVHSPFDRASGTPVQNFAARVHAGGAASPDLPEAPVRDERGGRGTVEVQPEWREALADLERCDRIWLVFWADRAAPARARVVPYRDTLERGLFATRAPARPNPIGISCIHLLGIRGRFLHVDELDLLDGTPVLDIKPYVAEYDSFPLARPGWLADPSAIPGPLKADDRFESERLRD